MYLPGMVIIILSGCRCLKTTRPTARLSSDPNNGRDEPSNSNSKALQASTSIFPSSGLKTQGHSQSIPQKIASDSLKGLKGTHPAGLSHADGSEQTKPTSSRLPLHSDHLKSLSYTPSGFSHSITRPQIDANDRTIVFQNSSKHSGHSNCSFSVEPNLDAYPFSYIIPRTNDQACNIYGPLCQTGYTTVGVSLSGCQSTSETLTCSSYLSSQSTYLARFPKTSVEYMPDDDYADEITHGIAGEIAGYLPFEWIKGFGRSDECFQYINRCEYWDPYWKRRDKLDHVFEDFGCPANGSWRKMANYDQPIGASAMQPLFPPGVFNLNQSVPNGENALVVAACGGRCFFQVREVNLNFWTGPSMISECARRGKSVKTYRLPNSRANTTINGTFESVVTTLGQTL